MKWWQIGKRDADFERELRSDLELEEEEQRDNGKSAEEARYAAQRAFGNTTPPWVSVSSERGLANCPAMRPIFTTGVEPPKVSTIAICKMSRNVSRMLLALNSAKLSAQSPP